MRNARQQMAKRKNPTKQEQKRIPEISLTLPDRFYIENHGNLSVEEIARDLDKPIEVVQAYCQELVAKNPGKKIFRGFELMNRPKGKNKQKLGVVSMTEAASMVGDDAHKKYVTLEAINRALMEGNNELAKELKDRYDEQQRANKLAIRSKYKDMIHYIQSPDDEDF